MTTQDTRGSSAWRRGWRGPVVVAVGLFSLIALRVLGARPWAPAVVLALSASALTLVVFLLWRAFAALLTVQDELIRPTAHQRRRELEREKWMLLKALRELDDDHQMGKLSDADFAEAGTVLRQRAQRVLAELDQPSSNDAASGDSSREAPTAGKAG